ncbi:MAG TPA: tetratricopeptide repeat protein [Chroococcidiopsis sp.]
MSNATEGIGNKSGDHSTAWNHLWLEAIAALSDADYGTASDRFQRCLTLRPDHFPSYGYLGLALLLQGDEVDAQAVWFTALSELADETEAEGATAAKTAAVSLEERTAELIAILEQALPQHTAAEQRERLLGQMLAFDPTLSRACSQLAQLYIEQERWQEAIACYQHLAELTPDDPAVFNNLGVLFDYQSDFDQAIACYQRVLVIDPEQQAALYNLAQALEQQGRLAEAIACYDRILTLNPSHREAQFNQAILLDRLGQLEPAIAAYQRVLSLDPQQSTALANLGILWDRCGQGDEAIACYRQLIELEPRSPKAHYYLGYMLSQRGEFESAIAHCQQALAIAPDNPECYKYLGYAYSQQNDLAQATHWYRQALARSPEQPDAHWNYALALLHQGDYATGFAEYEWRHQMPDIAPPTFAQPRWDGSDLTGQTILLQAEQGLGDAIQFIRYAPLVAQYGGRVVVRCYQSLARLLTTVPGVDAIAPLETAPPDDFDVFIHLLSLPHLLGTTLETIPTPIPYVSAPTVSSVTLPPRSDAERLRIGIVWAGGAFYQANRARSCSLSHFRPLLDSPGVTLYSLQKGEPASQLQGPAGAGIHDLGPMLHDLADTAAAIAQLDLVITVDTSVAHLAGALGHPVWVLLPYVSDWRWLTERCDSPWYPGMRLFRQSRPGDWEGLFQQVKSAL